MATNWCCGARVGFSDTQQKRQLRRQCCCSRTSSTISFSFCCCKNCCRARWFFCTSASPTVDKGKAWEAVSRAAGQGCSAGGNPVAPASLQRSPSCSSRNTSTSLCSSACSASILASICAAERRQHDGTGHCIHVVPQSRYQWRFEYRTVDNGVCSIDTACFRDCGRAVIPSRQMHS